MPGLSLPAEYDAIVSRIAPWASYAAPQVAKSGSTSWAVAAVAAHGSHGSRKRRRAVEKASRPCHTWQSSGKCEYGDACRFGHAAPTEVSQEVTRVTSARARIRAAADARATAVYTSGSAGDAAMPIDEVMSVPAAAAGVTVKPRHPSLVERYYTQMFAPDVGGLLGHDQYVFMHTNRVCVVGIAAGHPLVSRAKEDPLVSLAMSKGFLGLAVTGKSKKGGVWVDPSTVIANATTRSGRSYQLRACMRGLVIEINSRLLVPDTEGVDGADGAGSGSEASPAPFFTPDPQLLTSQPEMNGYLAVLTIKLEHVTPLQDSLLTQPEYEQLRRVRAALPASVLDAAAAEERLAVTAVTAPTASTETATLAPAPVAETTSVATSAGAVTGTEGAPGMDVEADMHAAHAAT